MGSGAGTKSTVQAKANKIIQVAEQERMQLHSFHQAENIY